MVNLLYMPCAAAAVGEYCPSFAVTAKSMLVAILCRLLDCWLHEPHFSISNLLQSFCVTSDLQRSYPSERSRSSTVLLYD